MKKFQLGEYILCFRVYDMPSSQMEHVNAQLTTCHKIGHVNWDNVPGMLALSVKSGHDYVEKHTMYSPYMHHNQVLRSSSLNCHNYLIKLHGSFYAANIPSLHLLNKMEGLISCLYSYFEIQITS